MVKKLHAAAPRERIEIVIIPNTKLFPNFPLYNVYLFEKFYLQALTIQIKTRPSQHKLVLDSAH